MAEQWFRHKWLEAIYASDLDPTSRHVAEIFAGKARQDSIAWEPLSNLVRKTGRTKTTCSKARQNLIDYGWLTETKAATHKAAAHFVLVIPTAEGSSHWTPQDEEGVQPLDPRGLATGPQGSSEETPRGLVTRPSQSFVNPDQSILSLTPEQVLVKDLLGLDDGDERLMKVPQLLEAKKPDSPKPWLRGCHKSGDLLDLLDTTTSPSSSRWGQASDDGLMDNPNYVEGFGNNSRIAPEDHYRPKMQSALGATDDEIRHAVHKSTEAHPGASQQRIWQDAYMTLEHDLICPACTRPAGKHYDNCIHHQRESVA